jgi:hypothetical protein
MERKKDQKESKPKGGKSRAAALTGSLGSMASGASAHLMELQGLVGNQSLARLLATGSFPEHDENDNEDPASETVSTTKDFAGKKKGSKQPETPIIATQLVRPSGSEGSQEQAKHWLNAAYRKEQQLTSGRKTSVSREKLLQKVISELPSSVYAGMQFTAATGKDSKDDIVQTWTAPSQKIQYAVTSHGEGARQEVNVMAWDEELSPSARQQTTETWVANRIPRASTEYWKGLASRLKQRTLDHMKNMPQHGLDEDTEEMLHSVTDDDDEE